MIGHARVNLEQAPAFNTRTINHVIPEGQDLEKGVTILGIEKDELLDMSPGDGLVESRREFDH